MDCVAYCNQCNAYRKVVDLDVSRSKFIFCLECGHTVVKSVDQ